ncbi:MAG: aminopeptidase N [Bacteriovoracaceae bacterium]
MKLLILLLFIITSFHVTAVTRLDEDNLTETFSSMRKAQIKNAEYFLNFVFAKGSNEFQGKAIIKVELNHLKHDLSIDAFVKKIEEVKINGESIAKYKLRKHSLDISKGMLSSKMEIEISYIGEFSKSSSGFKHITDPLDGEEYLFTDFEPYYAHWLFPCFDQPNIKSIFHVTVTAPSGWKVIHNEMKESEIKGKNSSVTSFRATPLISPYLFFLGAGPYHEWNDKFQDLPLVLYARKSVAKDVDAENIFEITKKGLAFFNDYFGYPYPFSIYGQIFVPEFAWSGMENPGAVTLNERFIFKGPVSKAREEGRQDLIMHEMAHMWFGDLVTMDWWKDLWLNESFASYLSGIAMERAIKSPATWLDFFTTKAWGYWQDQLVTTHPIETKVPDIRTAKGNFDGITYAKGASALKQLHFYVGEEGFREGLRNYFKKFAFKNTTRKDFIDAIAASSKKDLTNWTKKWLQTAGPNKVEFSYKCENGKIKSASVLQTKNNSGSFSPHATKFAFFKKKEKLELTQVIDVIFETASTPVAVSGFECPDFVLPNYQDYDYALYALDKASLKMAEIALTELPDPLSRLMVWFTLGQMLRDSKIAPAEYFRLAIKGLEFETEDLLLGQLIGRHSPIKSYFDLYLDKAQKVQYGAELEKVLWKRIESSPEGSSLRINFFDFFISMAFTDNGLNKLAELLNANSVLGMTLDQDRRWSIIGTLAMNGYAGAENLIKKEEEKDQSTIGKRYAYASWVSIPELENKKRYWEKLTGHHQLSYSDLREASSRFNGAKYPELISPFVGKFFKKVSSMNWKKADDSEVGIYFDYLFPLKSCSREVLEISKKSLKSSLHLTDLARRNWLESNDELQRCVKVRGL